MNLIQITDGYTRRVALVNGGNAEVLAGAESVYSLAQQAIRESRSLSALVGSHARGESLDYDPIYSGRNQWRLLPSFDHPSSPSHCMVSGTGLTHKASAENRAAMHQSTGPVTDSMRMYQMGLAGGNPAPGAIGVQPEWFYKGDGSILRAHGEPLAVPPYAEDGGEEPEIAGVYIISPEGTPFRVGLTMGDEFSDHKMEKRNYLYLAHSKLRSCSIGPELIVGDFPFDDVTGTVNIFRNGACLWRKDIFSGAANMCHSLANLEHHHFKHEPHRHPGDVHIHFFGADAFSFGEGIALQNGDIAEIAFHGFGRPLRNPVAIAREEQQPVSVARL